MAQPTSPRAAAPPLAAADGQPRSTATQRAEAAALRTVLRTTPGVYARAWRTLRRDRVAMACIAFLALVFVFVVGAGVVSRLTGFSFSENHLSAKLTAPLTDGYVLGSDNNGRDVLTRLAYGGRISLAVGLLATISLMVLGVGVGMVTGYLGGKTDTLIMRFIDVMMSIPTLPLLILIATLFQPGPIELAFVLAIVGWPGVARVIRGEVLSLRSRDFIDAARVIGASSWRVMFRHIQPNVLPIVIVYTSLVIPGLIISESALSFIGVGVQVPTPSWGNMLNEAYSSFRLNVANLIIPGAMIYFTSLAFFLLGSGLRDALDPQLNG